ncbi:MAG: hypothetical protein ACOYKA_02860 [Legionellaceae bacterium]
MSVGTVVRNIGIGTRYTGQFFRQLTNLGFIMNVGPDPYHLWSDETTVREAGRDLCISLFLTGILGALLGVAGALGAAICAIPAVTLFLGLALTKLGEWIEQQEEAYDHQLSMG